MKEGTGKQAAMPRRTEARAQWEQEARAEATRIGSLTETNWVKFRGCKKGYRYKRK
jgi:hypothetical protein